MSRHALVVDDDPVVRLLVSALLRRAEWSVESAENGARALELMDAESFDVVISDANMPVLDGLGLFTRLRADAGTVNLPFVLLSATAECPALLQNAPHTYLFVKPVNARTFVAELDALLG